MASLRPPNDIYYDCWTHPPNDIYHDFWFNPEVFRRRLDECTDPNCPLLLNATYLTEEVRREKVQRRRDTKTAELEETVEARLKEVQRRWDTKTAELEDTMKDVLELKAEVEKDQSKFTRKLGEEKEDFYKKKQDLVDQEKKLRELIINQQQPDGQDNQDVNKIKTDLVDL